MKLKNCFLLTVLIFLLSGCVHADLTGEIVATQTEGRNYVLELAVTLGQEDIYNSA